MSGEGERRPDGVFGMPIERDGEAPPILSKVLRYLLQKGVTTEGIFVVTPHATKELQALRRHLKTERESVQISSHTKNPHVVAEVTKQFLQMLPEPLLTFEHYDAFLLLLNVKRHDDRMAVAKQLISRLPNGFRSTVKQVLGLLSRVVAHRDYTKVTASSMAAIFAPIFLRAPLVHYRQFDAPLAERLMEMLITEYDAIVKNSSFQAVPDAGPPLSVAPRLPRAASIRYQAFAKTSKYRVPVLFNALHQQRTQCGVHSEDYPPAEDEPEEEEEEQSKAPGQEAAQLHAAAEQAEEEFASLAGDLETLAAEAARSKQHLELGGSADSIGMGVDQEEDYGPENSRSMIQDSRDSLPSVALEMVHQTSVEEGELVENDGEGLDASENIDLSV